MLGYKDVENRTWSTEHRGPLLIHASTKGEVGPRGAIIGAVDVVDVVDDSSSPWAMRGWRHWLLANPRPLVEPVPVRGQRRLFQVPLSEPLASLVR